MASGSPGGGKRGGGFNPFGDAPVPINVVTLSGGAAVGVVALYGIKKLYDYLLSSPVHGAVLVSPVKPPDVSPFMPDVIADHVPSTSHEPHRGNGSSVDPKRGNGSSVDPKRGNGSSVDPEPWQISSAETRLGLTTTPAIDSELSPSDSPRTSSTTGSPRKLSGNSSPAIEAASQYDQTLYRQLIDFHSSYARIDMDDLSEALQIVDEMKHLFTHMFFELLPNHPIHELREAGDAAEGLLVISPDHFELRIPLGLDAEMWEIIDAGDSILSAHGYCFIKRKHLEFFSPGSTRYDKYMVGDYLAPHKICAAIQDMTHRVGKWSQNHRVQASVVYNEIQLTVIGDDGNNIVIDFIPDVKLCNQHVMATPHPRCSTDPSFVNLWRSAFNDQEKNKLLSSLSSYPNGCQLLCLQIFRALQFRYPEQLGIYSSCVGKSVVMYLMDEDTDWSGEALAARFLDILRYFRSAVESRTLPHYFLKEYNLLQDISHSRLDATQEFLDNIISENNFSWFLRVD